MPDWITGKGLEKSLIDEEFEKIKMKLKSKIPANGSRVQGLKKLEEAKALFEIAVLRK